MAPRIELQQLLVDLLGSPNVYFKPPPSVLLKYPCVVYHRDSIETEFADNAPYSLGNKYKLTVIYTDPDSDISRRIAELSKCSFERFFVSDGLNHDVFNLFF